MLRSMGLNLLEGEMNQLLRIKLRDSFIMPKKFSKMGQVPRPVEFSSDFESSNLEYASEVAPFQYEIYLRNDSNTHGHQAWFCFRIKSNQEQPITVNLSICNIKRDLKLFLEGEKIFVRKVGPKGEIMSDWQAKGENIQFKVNQNNKFSISRVYKLSFDVELQPS